MVFNELPVRQSFYLVRIHKRTQRYFEFTASLLIAREIDMIFLNDFLDFFALEDKVITERFLENVLSFLLVYID